MATWTFVTGLSSLFGFRQPVYLSNKLYYIDNRYQTPFVIDQNPAGVIYEYNLLTDVSQAVLTPVSFTDHLSSWSIAIFNGNLYAAIELFTFPDVLIRVYRYSGTPENWTQVLALSVADSGMDRYVRLYSTDTEMFLYCRDYINSSGLLRYTSDGSSWNVGTIPTLYASTSFMELDKITYWPLGIYERACANNDSPGNSCDDTDVYQLSSTAMSLHQANPAGELHQSAPNSSKHAADQGYYSMPLNMATKSLIDDPDELISCLRAINAIEKLIGVKINGNNTELYEYDPTGDVFGSLLETMIPNAGVNPNFAGDDGWIINGSSNAWLAGNNQSTGNWELWERSTAFPTPSVSGSRLWIYKTEDKGLSWSSRGVKT